VVPGKKAETSAQKNKNKYQAPAESWQFYFKY
jgi:hypothetical protein